MGTQSKTIKLPIIFAAITALIICTVLGVVGIRTWRLLRPKPIFSFDTMEISQIQIHVRAGLGGESNIVMILDQERISSRNSAQPVLRPTPHRPRVSVKFSHTLPELKGNEKIA